LVAISLDKRAEKIRDDIEEAETLRKEAQDLLASYQRKQRDAIRESEDMIQQAESEAKRTLAHGQKVLKESLERRHRLTLERIEQAETQALDSVRASIVDMALNITREFLVQELKDKRAKVLIDSAIQELPNKFH
jgi:F-type H+-transporting ATPase subunit b